MANRRRPRSRLHAVMRWGLLTLLILFVYWDNTALRTDSLTYTSTALPAEFDGLRIVQLSDLHNREFGKNNQRLYAAVKQAAPDLIFLTGDLVDEYAEAPIPYAKAVGKALSAIAPTYYVTGNHEWAHGNTVVEEIKAALREAGVLALERVEDAPGGIILLRSHVVDPQIIAACREKGVLVIKAKDKLRLLPALNIPMDQLAKAVAVIKECCAG